MQIREYENKDIAELVSLWHKTFGDSEEFIRNFYEMLPNMGSCIVGIEQDKIIAMASVIAGQELLIGGTIKKPEVGYIYAVAVDENYRGKGYGIEISKAAYDLAIKREAMIVSVLPASDSLYDFYAENLDMEVALYRTRHEISAENIEMTMKLTSTEYSMMKDGILNGKTYLHLSPYAMEYFKKSLEISGGGLYASMSGICSAQIEGDTCIMHEVISNNPEATAAAVAYTLNCRTAVYYLPSEKGEKYIMADKGKIPADAIYNISYE